jgi:hypothetical protein
MLGKFRKGVDETEKSASDIAQGNYTSDNTPTGNENNQTAGKINGELDNNNDTQSGGTNNTQANNNLPLSSNAMRSLDTTNTGTPDGATTQANNTASSNTNGLTGTGNQTQSQQDSGCRGGCGQHYASLRSGQLLRSLTASTVAILADNDGNFRTLGTGAAMSLASKSNSIAVGVAVSVTTTMRTLPSAARSPRGKGTSPPKRSSRRTWTVSTKVCWARRRWRAPSPVRRAI